MEFAILQTPPTGDQINAEREKVVAEREKYKRRVLAVSIATLSLILGALFAMWYFDFVSHKFLIYIVVGAAIGAAAVGAVVDAVVGTAAGAAVGTAAGAAIGTAAVGITAAAVAAVGVGVASNKLDCYAQELGNLETLPEESEECVALVEIGEKDLDCRTYLTALSEQGRLPVMAEFRALMEWCKGLNERRKKEEALRERQVACRRLKAGVFVDH